MLDFQRLRPWRVGLGFESKTVSHVADNELKSKSSEGYTVAKQLFSVVRSAHKME